VTTERPGKIGKAYPVNDARENNGPTAQASIVGDRYGWIALIIGVIALVLAVIVIVAMWGLAADLNEARRAIETASVNMTQSAVAAATSADRADRAERRANIAEAYAKQVYVELNRLGYPVQTPIEEHSVAPVEAFKHDP
jgi:hypothetical protein